MKVYWLERSAADVPSTETWLSASEVNHLRTLRFAKRRADWLLGRWAAKNAVAVYLGLSAEPIALAGIEVRQQATDAPQAFCQDAPAPVSISLSHRAGLGACTVAPSATLVGCDLEIAEPHSDAFLTDYFAPEEQAMVVRAEAADRVWLLSLLWSAKESALKARGEGLRLDTRHLTVTFSKAADTNAGDGLRKACSIPGSFHRNCWNPIQVHTIKAQILDGWWNSTGTVLRTVIFAPAP
jgi:4'-phosphopantetheinyl transferase